MIIKQHPRRKVKCARHAMELLNGGYVLKYENYYYKLNSCRDSINLFRTNVNDVEVIWCTDTNTDLREIFQFCDKQAYHEVEEAKRWYDDIPKTGVLCKVADSKENLSVYNTAIIVGYRPSQDMPFISLHKNIVNDYSNTNNHKFAVPLTFDEIQKYTL